METAGLDETQPPYFVGVDVGGTSIKIGIVDDEGATLARGSIPTESDTNPQEAIQQICQEINRLASESGLPEADIQRIGLGTPGTMDIPRGMILEPPNLPAWRNFPIRDELARASGKKVTFSNDANAAAYGEYWIGSGKQYRSIVMLTLGTGVGGGIILDGHSVNGESSHGGECGHVVIDRSPDARICSCGMRGHLEAYASASALIQRCHEALDAGEESSLHEVVATGERLTGLDIAVAAEQGDELANRLILDTADYLATGVAIFLTTLDPSAVILGGAMNFGGSNHPVGKCFIDRIRATAGKMTLPVVMDHSVIMYAGLGGNAGYIGAAGLAREDFYRSQQMSGSGV